MVSEQQCAITPKLAAKYLGLSQGVLRLWRSQGIGPIYFKAGPKLIRYRNCDLNAWVEARVSTPAKDIERRQ